jgi:hypothetical protein
MPKVIAATTVFVIGLAVIFGVPTAYEGSLLPYNAQRPRISGVSVYLEVSPFVAD